MNLAKKIDALTVERTSNGPLVRSILSDKELLKRANIEDLSSYNPEYQDDIIYLIAFINNDPIGVIIFHSFNNDICSQIHVNYLPEFWGYGLPKLTKLSINWLFDNTNYKKIVCFAPSNYPEVESHAKKCGLIVNCILKNSDFVDNKYIDQKLMSISKKVK